MVIGGQGVRKTEHEILCEEFDKITTNPRDALDLIVDNEYN